MNIKLYKEDEFWIVASDDPDLVTQGYTELQALQRFVDLYEIETNFELQREIFGY